MTPQAKLATAQGGYFLATGVWPIVSLRSFEAITGPKEAPWLVKTFGALVGSIGAVMLGAGRAGRVSRELEQLAVGSALALAVMDTVYVLKRRISPVYLADAAVELALAAAWWRAADRRRDRQVESPALAVPSPL